MSDETNKPIDGNLENAPSAAGAAAADAQTGQHDPMRELTRIAHDGLAPFTHFGFVNPPAYRGSTVLYPDYAALKARKQPYTYGRRGTPTVDALQTAIANLEGGKRTILTSSGLAAINLALFAFVEQGDHILITDSVYQPTRSFADQILKKFGVETSYYDPTIGAGIADLMRPNTKVIFTESPGSQTFEMQDIPAISEVARAKNVWHITDNTWASPLFLKPFAHGVDVSIQAATKYIVGHSDAMLGAVTVTDRAEDHLMRAFDTIGMCPGSEETYLGLRGIRTIDVRLQRHWQSAVEMAQWLEARPEVERVLYPALPSHPGHDIWKRDYHGASGLFGAILKPCPEAAVAAFLNELKLFGMGFSWGGFESLVIPVNPRGYRTATTWDAAGPTVRFHIGLEDTSDLKADLDAGFARLTKVAAES